MSENDIFVKSTNLPFTSPASQRAQRVATCPDAGAAVLSERTLSQEVRPIRPLGRGRSGEVWCAEWRGRYVAVKSFSSRDQPLWKREVDLYLLGLRHENLLGFIAADLRGIFRHSFLFDMLIASKIIMSERRSLNYSQFTILNK